MVPRAKLLQLADAAVAAYNSWDINQIIAFRSSDCQTVILPASAGVREPLNNAQYRNFFEPQMQYFRNFHLTVRSTAIDTEANKVVMHASSTADTEVGGYQNEYMLTLTATEDGKKCARFEEFIDMGKSADFFQRLDERLKATGRSRL